MKIQDLVKKMSFAMSIEGSEQINYILIPYRRMLAASVKLSCMLFLLVLVSADLLIAVALVPAYLILLYNFWQLYKAVKLFEFKALPVFGWFVLSSLPFALTAVGLRTLFIAMLG